MNWFERHLNITWAIVWFFSPFVVGVFSSVPIVMLGSLVIFYGVTLWVLHRKSRSWLWVLIPVAVLVLSNQRETHKRIVWRSGDNTKIVEESGTTQELQEQLSCLTCDHFNGQEQEWCGLSGEGPSIVDKYCRSFTAKQNINSVPDRVTQKKGQE